MNTKVSKSQVDYEEGYHEVRHATHYNDDYYEARAKIALKKFFFRTDRQAEILDFGCGLGQNIYYMPNAQGYDISQHGVAFCAEKGIKATNNLEDLPNSHFKHVFSAHVLEHHPHPKSMLNDIHSKMVKGGELILVLPYERHSHPNTYDLDINQHLYCWNFQNINNLLITSGFKIISNKYIRGAGYNKLLPLYKLNFNLYWYTTNLLSRLVGIKEMMIVATKV